MKFTDEGQGEELSFEVNVISLVDILFLLVIFFAVTTTFNEEHGIAVELPQASAGKLPPAEVKPLVVSLPSDTVVLVGEKQIGYADLEAQLLQAKESLHSRSVVIRADKRVSHGTVVSVMEAAKSAGLDDIAFATSEKK